MAKKKKIKVGVIFGGRSGEHEVSFVSAQSVIKALDQKKYQVIPILVSKSGQWRSSRDAVAKIKAGQINTIPEINFSPDHQKQSIDVAFPVIHGTYGEDGSLQGLLELANIPYVGAGVMASAVAMDKIISKRLFQEAGLPIIKFLHFLREDFKKNKEPIVRIIKEEFHYPIFIKPANSGSSVGINKAKNQNQLKKHIYTACRYDRKILIEQGIEDYHELEVAILGNDKPKASVVGEVFSCNEFYDYQAKYVAGKTKTVFPAKIPVQLAKQVQTMAIKSFKTLDCAGMARVDFLYDIKVRKLYISEINTIPGFTSISMYPKLWSKSGLSYPKLLDKLISLAITRHLDKNQSLTSYKQKSKWYKN